MKTIFKNFRRVLYIKDKFCLYLNEMAVERKLTYK